jgi:hypothetical protein
MGLETFGHLRLIGHGKDSVTAGRLGHCDKSTRAARWPDLSVGMAYSCQYPAN